MKTPQDSSAVNSELLGVSLLPGRSDGWSSVGGSPALLAKASVLLAGRGQATQLTAVVLLGDDPVDARVFFDGGVSGVDNDDLEELVGSVLTAPVGVQDSHVGALSADLLLGNRSVGSSLLELSDTKVNWLTIDGTLVDCSLSTSSSDSNSVDDVSLLLFESESSGLIKS